MPVPLPPPDPAPDAFMRSFCALGTVPGVAEIRLHLADDVMRIWQRTEDDHGADQPPPFWAFAWPGGQALARYVLDHPGVVAGRTVLDLGSGSGLVAIAASLAGASRVLASEIDPLAAAAIRVNAAANGVRMPGKVGLIGDVLDGDGEGADVVLAGDVWYSRPFAERVLGFVERARGRGAAVLTGDIGRAFLPKDRFVELDARDFQVLAGLENASVKRAMVWEPAW
jgi:predicted nicotinamide N-methyase